MAKRGGEAERFGEFIDRLADAVGHADRREPLRAYICGLLMAGERKSVEPMAARVDPRQVGARHQSMHHFVAAAPWEEKAVMATARDYVRAAHRDYWRSRVREPEWLLIEWPQSEKAPPKYWLSNVPEAASLDDLVRLAKLRWRIERDYQELKDEIGLDHYEGRGWRGFHHHGALCIAAYSFLAAERARLPPPAHAAFLRPARLPKGFRPRGSSAAA